MGNVVYRPNALGFVCEDWDAPRLVTVRKTYPLAAQIAGEGDTFARLLRLRHWTHRQVTPNPRRPAIDDHDALRILEDGPRGGQYHCTHLSKALHAVLNATGHVARLVFAGAGAKSGPLSGAHGANEVWSNALGKWVLLDAEHDFHFEKDGVPLSALETRDEVWRDGAKGVTRVKGPERHPLLAEPDDSYGRTARTYAFVSFCRDGNRETIWPKSVDSREIVLEDAAWRGNVWGRGGAPHWAYAAGQFQPVAEREKIEWTPGVLKVDVEGGTVRIVSETPNLREYQMRVGDGDWQRVADRFPHPGRRCTLRALNRAGVAGPEFGLEGS